MPHSLTVLLTLVGGLIVGLVVILVALRQAGVWGSPNHRLISKPPGTQRRISARGRARRRRLVIRRGIAAGVVALAVAGITEGIFLAQATNRLIHGTHVLRDASSSLGNSPSGWTGDHIQAANALAQESLTLIKPGADRLRGDPLLKAFSYVPLVGSQVSAGFHLADAAESGLAGFNDVLDVARAVDASRNSTEGPGPRLLGLLKGTRAAWADAASQMAPRVDQLNGDLTKLLFPPLATEVRHARDLLSPIADLAKVGAIAGQYAPTALGESHPTNYLVLLANPSEIRPAGGFVGAVGTVTFSGGAPSRIDVKGQEFYNPLLKLRVPPPYPLGRYLTFFDNSLEIGDAGWDPDFPTSANLSEQLFTSATDQPVDGTISVDPYAISALLAVTGPLDVAPYGAFDSNNFFAKLNFIVNASKDPGAGKQALAPISQALLIKVLTQAPSVWPRMATVFRDQASTRHIQVHLHDPKLAAAAARVHYDGAILPDASDYLMVTDANVGATKGDYFARKSTMVRVELHENGLSRHEVELNYNMPSALDDVDRALNPGLGEYHDYIKLYLPQTALFAGVSLSRDGQDAPFSIDTVGLEHGHRTISMFLPLPRSHSARIRVEYETANDPTSAYHLFIQKQAGVASRPTSVEISYSGGDQTFHNDLINDWQLTLAE